MITNTEFEKIFFLFTLKYPKYLTTIEKGFYETSELDVLSYISKNFFKKYKDVPTKEQLKFIVKEKFSGQVNDKIIDLIFETGLDSYDEKWLKETVESWIRWKNLDKSILETIEFVKTTKVTPDNVSYVVGKVKELIVSKNSISFDDKLGLNFFDVNCHKIIKQEKIQTGYRFLNHFTNGGYDLKSLVVYAGQMNIGKSIWLVNDACNFVKLGKNVVYITAEMSEYKVLKRAGSNLLSIKISEYDKKVLDKEYIEKKINILKSSSLIPLGQLFIKEYPTSQATVDDIEYYIKDLEQTQGFKVDVVVVDYINILCNKRNPNSENTYMKIKQIAEDLRGMAVRNEWLVITATQITRSGYDSSEITLSHISESAGLSHTADVVLGIIQTPENYRNNIYWLKILKIRDGFGKNAKTKFNINYEYMKLTETDEMVIDEE